MYLQIILIMKNKLQEGLSDHVMKKFNIFYRKLNVFNLTVCSMKNYSGKNGGKKWRIRHKVWN